MNVIKSVSIFVIGAAIGVGASYKYFENKFREIADEEIESVKMMVKNRELKSRAMTGADWDDEKITTVKLPGKADAEETKDTRITETDAQILERKNNENLTKGVKTPPYTHHVKTMYNKAVKPYDTAEKQKPSIQEEDYNDENDYSSAQVDVLKKATKPYIISPDQFVQECRGNSKVTLNYYDIDDKLIDEDDEIMDMIDVFVGYEALTSWGAKGADNDVVYVRNEKLSIDYEIIKNHMSYDVDILGFHD